VRNTILYITKFCHFFSLLLLLCCWKWWARSDYSKSSVLQCYECRVPTHTHKKKKQEGMFGTQEQCNEDKFNSCNISVTKFHKHPPKLMRLNFEATLCVDIKHAHTDNVHRYSNSLYFVWMTDLRTMNIFHETFASCEIWGIWPFSLYGLKKTYGRCNQIIPLCCYILEKTLIHSCFSCISWDV
jgi:hypothetical protein